MGVRSDRAGAVVAEPAISARSVFVVHGRNEALRKAMFDFLRSINLSPMEWSHAVQLTGEGSPYIGQVLDAALSNAAAVSYTHLRAHETRHDLVCRLLLE